MVYSNASKKQWQHMLHLHTVTCPVQNRAEHITTHYVHTQCNTAQLHMHTLVMQISLSSALAHPTKFSVCISDQPHMSLEQWFPQVYLTEAGTNFMGACCQWADYAFPLAQ